MRFIFSNNPLITRRDTRRNFADPMEFRRPEGSKARGKGGKEQQKRGSLFCPIVCEKDRCAVFDFEFQIEIVFTFYQV